MKRTTKTAVDLAFTLSVFVMIAAFFTGNPLFMGASIAAMFTTLLLSSLS